MKTDTRAALIDDATAIVRRKGYAGFSYADLAEAAGIRKPSIHHHFPLKEDLGAAIVEVYTARFMERLETMTGGRIARLSAYAGLYREGLAGGQGCLCGVLASELTGLPPKVRAGVARFFDLNLAWLETVLGPGPGAKDRARTVLSTFQGAIFVALAMNSPAVFDAAVEGLLTSLSG